MLTKRTLRQIECEGAENYDKTPLGDFDDLLGSSAAGR